MTVALFALLSLLKAIRVPNTYSISQWLLDYGDGFTRRALLGTALRPLLEQISPRAGFGVIVVLSLLALLTFLGAAAALGWWAAKRQRHAVDALLVCPLFLASPAFVMVVHCIGYLDVVTYGLGLWACWLVARSRHLEAGLVIATAAAVHELALFVVVPPLTVGTLALSLTEGDRDRRPRAKVMLRCLAVCAPALVFGVAALWVGNLDAEELRGVQARALSLEIVSYDETPWTFHALENTLSSNLATMAQHWQKRSVWRSIVRLLQHLPFVALCLLGVVLNLRRATLTRRSVAVLAALGAIACLAPLGIHAVAWDDNRIDAFMGIAAFQLWLVTAAAEPRQPAGAPGPWKIGALIAVLHLSSAPQLLDGQHVALYPEMITRIPGELRKLRRPPTHRQRAGALLFDNASFEAGTLQGWQTSGWAFDGQPVDGEASGKKGALRVPDGAFWVRSYVTDSAVSRRRRGTAARGRLVSSPFVVIGDAIVFKARGKCHDDRVYVTLIVEGREVGAHCPAKLTTQLELMEIDVSTLRDRTVRIAVVDASKRGFLAADGFRWRRAD